MTLEAIIVAHAGWWLFGVGKITKFREDDMVEIDLLWTLGDNKPVKLIVHKTEIDHMSDSNELLDGEITPLSDSESDSLEYSDSDSELATNAPMAY